MPVIGRETQEHIERLEREIDIALSYDLPVQFFEFELQALSQSQSDEDAQSAISKKQLS